MPCASDVRSSSKFLLENGAAGDLEARLRPALEPKVAAAAEVAKAVAPRGREGSHDGGVIEVDCYESLDSTGKSVEAKADRDGQHLELRCIGDSHAVLIVQRLQNELQCLDELGRRNGKANTGAALPRPIHHLCVVRALADLFSRKCGGRFAAELAKLNAAQGGLGATMLQRRRHRGACTRLQLKRDGAHIITIRRSNWAPSVQHVRLNQVVVEATSCCGHRVGTWISRLIERAGVSDPRCFRYDARARVSSDGIGHVQARPAPEAGLLDGFFG